MPVPAQQALLTGLSSFAAAVEHDQATDQRDAAG